MPKKNNDCEKDSNHEFINEELLIIDKKINLLVIDKSQQIKKIQISDSPDVQSITVAESEEQVRQFLRKEGQFTKAPNPDVILFDVEPIIKSGITS